MNKQTGSLLKSIPSVKPMMVLDLITAYKAINPQNILQSNLYAEPYYGDYNKNSLVLLTHNPGQSTVNAKGVGSDFEKELKNNIPPSTIADNYFKLATIPNFPNIDTNIWIENRNTELKNHFNGLIEFENQLFIRDLIPYHGKEFGEINMTLCTVYLYKYFFNQVITSSFASELYNKINCNQSNLATIIYARGSAWNGNFGLSSVGWDFIGKIYWNTYIYKANFTKIKRLVGFESCNYPTSILNHDIYIIACTQPNVGANFGIYLDNKAPLVPIPLIEIIDNYHQIQDKFNPYFINKSPKMVNFFKVLIRLQP